MNPSSLMNPANPGSPIWIANQVAQQNAARAAAAAGNDHPITTTETVMLAVLIVMVTLVFGYMVYMIWKES